MPTQDNLHDAFAISLEGATCALGDRTVLSGMTWRFEPGNSWLLLGGNGAGKTSFLRLLRGDLWPDPRRKKTGFEDGVSEHTESDVKSDSLSAARQGGRIVYEFADGHVAENPIRARESIAFLAAETQDDYLRHGWDMPVEEVVASGLFRRVWLQEPLDPNQLAAVEDAMARFGVAGLRGRMFLTLSTGQARAVLLARAMVARPSLLLLDEFCNGLDIEARAHVLELLSRVIRDGTDVVLSTHRTDEIVPEIGHVLILETGRIAKTMPREEFDEQVADRDREKDHQTGGRVASEAFEPSQFSGAASGSPMQPTNGKAAPLIEIVAADVILGETTVLRCVDWAIRPSEHWAILGPNGSGKSTFLRLIHGDLFPAAPGRVNRFGLPGDTPLNLIKRRIGFVSPHFQADYSRNIPAFDAILSGLHATIGLYRRVDDEERARAEKWLFYFELEDVADRLLRRLSYGQQRRVLLARAMVNNPEILLLDEPFNGLDKNAAQRLRELLEQLTGANGDASGTQIVLTTHHPDEMLGAINRVGRFQDGRLIIER